MFREVEVIELMGNLIAIFNISDLVAVVETCRSTTNQYYGKDIIIQFADGLLVPPTTHFPH